MKIRFFLLVLVAAASAFGQYSYENVAGPSYDDPNPALWSRNGAGVEDVTPGVAFAHSGSYIYVPTIASGGNANDYEIRSTFSGRTCWEACIEYVRASSDALAYGQGVVNGGWCSDCASLGSYTSVEITAASQLTVKQCSSGSCTSLGGTTLVVPTTMLMRTVVWGTNLRVYINDSLVWSGSIPLTYGQPGIGGTGNITYNQYLFVTDTYVGHRDSTEPSAVLSTSLRSSILPSSASLAWQGAADDANGIGVYGYNISRSDVGSIGFSRRALFNDSVSPGTTYTYSVSAVDYHGNTAPSTSWTITTPPANSVDPRRTGIYNTGSYWGGGGEQIDTLSGNLNYTLPLVTPMARPGWKVPIGLVYNSQNWRQDNGSNWELGDDVGYGFGWKLQIGSITPYYEGFGNGVDHYVFTDSSGAEYRLDQNDGSGVWSSTQGIYVWFDSNANTLYFRNGTFWVMGATSGGSESDAGTMYPTVIEDSAGNYISILYQAGAGVPGSLTNTSSRILRILDGRGVYYPYCSCNVTYAFTYSTLGSDSMPHLSGITNYIGTGEYYNSFTYSASPVQVEPAFGADGSFSGVMARQLTAVVLPTAGTYSFWYDGGFGSQTGASELTQVTFPFGGHLAWDYASATYAGSRLLREVKTRYLAADAAGSTTWTYPFTHSDSLSTIATVHADTTLADASGVGAKTWAFQTSGTASHIGLISQFTQWSAVGGSVLTQDSYTWSTGDNPYIASKTSVRDGITGQSLTTSQTLDSYGNVTESDIYAYNSTAPATPLQKYTNTYINASYYLSAYIRDRLSTSSITTGGTTTQLIQNYYDQLYDNVYSTVGCTPGYGVGNFGVWAGFPHTYFSNYWPITGLVSSSVTAARSTCTFYVGGVASGTKRTDGPPASSTLNSTTGFMAPSAISIGSVSESFVYNPWLGITQASGPNGTMYMTYDTYGQPLTATSPFGTYGTPTVTYRNVQKGAFDPYTGLTSSVAEQYAIGPDGLTRTTLDGVGRPIKVEKGPDVSHIQSVVDTVYAPCACSPMAKIQSVSQPHAPGGTVYSTVYAYDGIGRPLSVTQPDGASATTYVYTGNQTKVIDAAGKWKQF
ncbi:MAG TPA: hypothetical protein VN519_11620, partial [Bryobacteraceae bacterium]|nr:hypothetical protein [Bryobacteraceae bacterium]